MDTFFFWPKIKCNIHLDSLCEGLLLDLNSNQIQAQIKPPSTSLPPPSATTVMANNDLFTSLISDIKSYSGKDPLLPWLRYPHFFFPISSNSRSLTFCCIMWLQRDSKTARLAAAEDSRGEAAPILAEMRAELSVRWAIPERATVPPSLVEVGN